MAMRSATIVKLIAACLVGLAASAVMPGCAHDSGGSRTVPEGVEYTIAVKNESKRAVQVTWAVAFRHEGEVGFGRPAERSLGTIEPGKSASDGPMTFGMHTSPNDTGPAWVQVLRILVTIPSASWQEPARMWWEVVGVVPSHFVVSDGRGPDGFGLMLSAEGTELEAVPRQFWTDDEAGEGSEAGR